MHQLGRHQTICGATPEALEVGGDPFRPHPSVVAYRAWKGLAAPDLFATSSATAVRRCPRRRRQRGLNRPLWC